MTEIESFRTAVAAGDSAATIATFADDVVLHSPAVISTEYAGRERVSRIMGFAARTLDGIRFTDELHSPDGSSHGLVFEATVGSQRTQGVFYLGTSAGRIASLTLLLRPVRAAQAFVEAMGTLGADPALDFAAGTE